MNPSYQDYVDNGVFAAYKPDGQLARTDTLDYIGVFGDRWIDGEPSYTIGPSGSDEEYYEEVYNWKCWRVAQGLRSIAETGAPVVRIGDFADLEGEFIPQQLDPVDVYIKAACQHDRGRFGYTDDQLMQMGKDWAARRLEGPRRTEVREQGQEL